MHSSVTNARSSHSGSIQHHAPHHHLTSTAVLLWIHSFVCIRITYHGALPHAAQLKAQGTTLWAMWVYSFELSEAALVWLLEKRRRRRRRRKPTVKRRRCMLTPFLGIPAFRYPHSTHWIRVFFYDGSVAGSEPNERLLCISLTSE